jgi:hypothetical protein
MSGPIGAGAGAPAARAPTEKESRSWRRIIYSRTPTSEALQWLRDHPDFPVDYLPHSGGEYLYTPIGTVLTATHIPATDPVVHEVLSRNPDFVKKDSNGETLMQFLDDRIRGLEQFVGSPNEFQNTAAAVYVRKQKRELLRKKIAELKSTMAALPMVDSVARQKNLPPDVGDIIASKLSGKTGTLKSQRAELQKQVGVSPKGGRRKTRRTRRRR